LSAGHSSLQAINNRHRKLGLALSHELAYFSRLCPPQVADIAQSAQNTDVAASPGWIPRIFPWLDELELVFVRGRVGRFDL
jgi:hypothetical protein